MATALSSPSSQASLVDLQLASPVSLGSSSSTSSANLNATSGRDASSTNARVQLVSSRSINGESASFQAPNAVQLPPTRGLGSGLSPCSSFHEGSNLARNVTTRKPPSSSSPRPSMLPRARLRSPSDRPGATHRDGVGGARVRPLEPRSSVPSTQGDPFLQHQIRRRGGRDTTTCSSNRPTMNKITPRQWMERTDAKEETRNDHKRVQGGARKTSESNKRQGGNVQAFL
mmetsp:Transcript_10230/g.62437  ORF Transcript_10230/g.62437 Transcript_10230/m.62437 type:complete len:229 (+) Transcript_10230:4489-5175(+)